MDKIQKARKDDEQAPEWFKDLFWSQAPVLAAKNPYGMGYPGDESLSMLGRYPIKQYGPMTEQQAAYAAAMAARKKAADNPISQLFRSGKTTTEEPGFLDFLNSILQLDRIGPKP